VLLQAKERLDKTLARMRILDKVLKALHYPLVATAGETKAGRFK
jgi:hypothetical protein